MNVTMFVTECWHFFWCWWHDRKANIAVAKLNYLRDLTVHPKLHHKRSWIPYWECRFDYHSRRSGMHYRGTRDDPHRSHRNYK